MAENYIITEVIAAGTYNDYSDVLAVIFFISAAF